MIFPVASDGPREVQSDLSPIVSLWRGLASMDRQSPEFLPLLSSLTVGDYKSLTIKLQHSDARDILTIMDEVLKKIPSEYERDTLHTMWKLAYRSGQVPARYQVDRHSLSREADVIAGGTFAEVRRGRLGEKAVAIRTLRTDHNTNGDKYQKHFCKECIIWMNVSHPNLLQLIAVDIDSQTGQCSMISELMVNGNIRDYIRHKSANRHRLLEDVAAGLCYLHEHDIVHGDLKGNNILITNDTPPRACLADFGLSTFAPSTQGVTTDTTGGTLLYMAPELIAPTLFGSSSARPTKPADIYALGMVILEVLTGAQPFSEKGWVISEAACHVVSGERPAKPGNAEQIGFGGGTWELVEECWLEAAKRPNIEQIRAHLIRIAASSTVVGPTPEVARSTDTPEIDAFSEMFPFHFATITAQNEVHCSENPIIDQITGAVMADTVSPTTAVGTTSILAAGALSPFISVSSKSSKGPSRTDVKPPTSSSKFSATVVTSQRLTITKDLLIDPENALSPTIPMPLLFAKKTAKSEHSGWDGFFNKRKPKGAMDHHA
ncbi:kinase-like domain-containing protein [Thelephora terrestris]|uniref:Kinase-like domain-containing protein n=1 Tax=Thelephora terrestris TaxID=56493 RepID=A0A9P6H7S5_9AGAM|nr:kinase-like domain-containing protein [Thelephora terrestris]